MSNHTCENFPSKNLLSQFFCIFFFNIVLHHLLLDMWQDWQFYVFGGLLCFLGPPPVTSPGKPRRDSDNSNHSQEVFSGGEDVKDEPRSPVSPAHRDESATKLIPAPPPVVNVWEKRKTETVVKTAVVSVKSPMEAHTHVKSETRSIADAPVCLFYYYYFFLINCILVMWAIVTTECPSSVVRPFVR